MHRKASSAMPEQHTRSKKKNWIIAFTGNEKKEREQHKQRSENKERISNRIRFFYALNMFDEKIAKVLQLHKSFEYINEKFVVRLFRSFFFFILVDVVVVLFFSLFYILHMHFNSKSFRSARISMQSQWYIFSNLNYVACSLHKKYIRKNITTTRRNEKRSQILESRRKKNQQNRNIDIQTHRYNCSKRVDA